MLKKRLIPCLVLRNNLIVQSINFKRYLPVGKANIAIEFVANWDVDEIVFLDISATRNKLKPNLGLVSSISERCFVPLTVGGGIKETDDIKNLINAGADKISINSIALERPEFIREACRFFGSQCIVVSIDVLLNSAGQYEVFSFSGKDVTVKDPVLWAKQVEELGAGEIFLNSVERDGSKMGYDLELIRSVSAAVTIPVIACGGVGKIEHLAEGILKGGACAVSAANIFHYVEHSTILAKAQLKAAGIDIRLNTAAKYEDFSFDPEGRVLKKDDGDLERIWFEKHQMEKI